MAVLRLAQVIRLLRKEGLSHNEIHAELVNLIDNGSTSFFDIVDTKHLSQIEKAFHNEMDYELAFSLAMN